MRVRYYGHIGEATGYGVAARAMCRSLVTVGVELEIRPLGLCPIALVDEGGLPLSTLLRRDDQLSLPDACIVHTLPNDCVKVRVTHDADEIPAPEMWIAYTTWEAIGSAPAAMQEALEDFDQVWTPSHASAKGLANNFDDTHRRLRIGLDGPPVLEMPHAYDPAMQWYVKDGVDGGAGRPYRFLYVGAWTARKNPAGLLRAFAHADFAPGEAELWLHSQGTSRETFAVAHAQTGCHDTMARVRFLNEPLSAFLMHEQYQRADCFVTASRGEAWNLPAFEAMLHGRHVISPTPLGSDDFLGDTTADLVRDGMIMPAEVDVTLGRTDSSSIEMRVQGAQGLTSRTTWWEPDLTEIALHMRVAVRDRRRDLRLTYNPADRYSYEAVGTLALKHLENL